MSGPGTALPAHLLGEEGSRARGGSRRPRPRARALRGPSQGTVVLVGCSAGKLSCAAPARDLYTSQLFKKSRAYAETRGCEWAILSARHGLVLPEQVLEPYDLSMRGLRGSAVAHRHWAADVGLNLNSVFPGARFVLLAGSDYRAAICHLPSSRREEPLAGLGIGERLSWLKRQVEHMGAQRG